MTTAWVLGDQLHRTRSRDIDAVDRVLMIESREFATRRPYHRQKLALVFAAMRYARDDLRNAGIDVAYHESASFADGLRAFYTDHPGEDLVIEDLLAHGAADRLRGLLDGIEDAGDLTVADHSNFLVDPDAFDDWHDGDTYRHESFYRGSDARPDTSLTTVSRWAATGTSTRRTVRRPRPTTNRPSHPRSSTATRCRTC